MTQETKFLQALKDVFVGATIEGALRVQVSLALYTEDISLASSGYVDYWFDNPRAIFGRLL